MSNKDNSDYNKVRTKLNELLPEPMQSDLNKSVFENLYNRFLTKQETKTAAGYIGKGNPTPLVNRQIRESDIHRQGNQLQPIMHQKIGSIDYMMNWTDILSELKRTGVDIEKLDDWGSVTEFNWSPPIDLDKLINYQDYYWYNSLLPGSIPDYIVIRNQSTTAKSRVAFWQNIIDEIGASTTPSRFGLVNAIAPVSFTIREINKVDSTITVDGKMDIVAGKTTQVLGTNHTNGDIQVVSAGVHDENANTTTFKVDSSRLTHDETLGFIKEYAFNTIYVKGNVARFFNEGFVFYYKNSTNQDLKNTWLTVASSEYESDTNTTAITLTSIFSSPILDGELSIQEQLEAQSATLNCITTGSSGWDSSGFDDNTADWAIDSANWLESIKRADVPTLPGADLDVAWVQSTDAFYQYGDTVGWKLLYNSFSLIVSQNTTGSESWDSSDNCGKVASTPTAKQWIDTNFWVHKSDVPNFSIAKQAKHPIIEYSWSLELNEWSHDTLIWKYRKDNYSTFETTTKQPHIFELMPLDIQTIDVDSKTVTVSEKYGDVTDWIKSGTVIQDEGRINRYIVESAEYIFDAATSSSKMHIVFQDVTDMVVGLSLYPNTTSSGHSWKEYNVHWLFVGKAKTTPINHQLVNTGIKIIDTASVDSGDFTSITSAFATEFTKSTTNDVPFILSGITPVGYDVPVNRRSLIGMNDVRVYVNDIRVVGTYNEMSEFEVTGAGDKTFVYAIAFLPGFVPVQFDIVRVETGAGSVDELGLGAVPVRMIEDNTEFTEAILQGNSTVMVSLITKRKSEQIKTKRNQYPLFDIYNTDGSSAHIANHIFGFATSAEENAVPELGMRAIINKAHKDYTFEQHLLTKENGELYAYRDFSNSHRDTVFNTTLNKVLFWNDTGWTSRIVMGNRLRSAVIKDVVPTDTVNTIDGVYWYSPVSSTLSLRTAGEWVAVESFEVVDSDPTMQSIWKIGKTSKYTPVKRDWKNRSLKEYNDERDLFMDAAMRKMQLTTNKSDSEIKTIASKEWLSTQTHDLSSTGEWKGEWEIPAPMYYNSSHENHKQVTSRELQTHFSTIITNQPKVPGFTGKAESMFHLIRMNDIDYGIGGKIKEYNGSFDTFMSSVFVNNITPLSLIDFAHDQYESLINSMVENFKESIGAHLININTESFTHFDDSLIQTIINKHENDNSLNVVYGDSSTFDGTTGVKNWIATLPYIKTVKRVKPAISTDAKSTTIVHHDGHRKSYQLPAAVKEVIIQRAIRNIDKRTGTIKGTFGKMSTDAPASTIQEFEAGFNTPVDNRNGVLWYHVGDTRTLYRLNVVSAGANEPSANYPDGSMWACTKLGEEGLRVKSSAGATTYWHPIAGTQLGEGKLHNGVNGDMSTATVNAWTVIDIDNILGKVVLTVEEKLYQSAPITEPVFDINQIAKTDEDKARMSTLLQTRFSSYIRENSVLPYINSEYDMSDPWTWNYRYCSPGASYEIIAASESARTFTVSGVQASFAAGMNISVKNSFSNDGKFVIDKVTHLNGNTVLRVTSTVLNSVQGVVYTGTLPSANNNGGESGGYWKDLYQKVYGTPMPHLEPWVLQGYTDKPSWWDAEYLNTDPTKNRKWKYDHSTQTGMWANIINGVIPVGKLIPGSASVYGTGAANEALNKFTHMSVNISNTPLIVNALVQYQPDSLLPPFFNHTAAGQPANSSCRSLFSVFGSEIISPGADYSFGDAGEVEYEWKNSSRYLYDLLSVAYVMQPVKFMDMLFGSERITVGGLNIDKNNQRVLSHSDTQFHGDIIDDAILKVNGLNQWYVNFNRHSGYDANLSDFRSLWVDWKVQLGYQFSSFIDTESLQVAHRRVDVSAADYHILPKKARGAQNKWLESFKISVLHRAGSDARYNSEVDYEFLIDTPSPLNRSISYYDVQNYQFSVDKATGIATLYSYDVKTANAEMNAFTVGGDQTNVFLIGRQFKVQGSQLNDASYTAISSVFDKTANVTIIKTKETNHGTSQIANGQIVADYRSIPWKTGDQVWLSSDRRLPSPLESDTIIGTTMYFIIQLSRNTFQLAETLSNAQNGIGIAVTDTGEGNSYIGKLHSTFAVSSSSNATNWRHYEIDRSTVLTHTPPFNVRGVQNVINMVRGYEEYKHDQGWRINSSNELTNDVLTDRLASWQVELEVFITFVYNLQHFDQQYDNTYTVDIANNAFIFRDASDLVTGDPIKVTSADAMLPVPFIRNATYYVIRDDAQTYRLATNRLEAFSGNSFDIPDATPVSDLMIFKAREGTNVVPSVTLNPFRERVWFRPEFGVVSDVVKGPSDDLRKTQLIFDQNGNALTDELLVLREDRETQIMLVDYLTHDKNNDNQFSHIGGCHLFLDEYEHVMLFESYTSAGVLLYDPFIGLNITKFEMIFQRQTELTKRPNIGGHYLSTNFNQGADIRRNIEASIEDGRYMYDTYGVNEASGLVQETRRIVGYEGPREYLSNLNLKEKSQFAFWKGMIQHKGAINAVDTFINSRRFIDAKVDEFWAIKVADFGSAGEREYPEMFLRSQDSKSNDLMVQFIGEDDYCYPGYDRNAYDAVLCGYDTPESGNPIPYADKGFTPIALTDTDRWYNQPEQLEMLRNNGAKMFFNMKPTMFVDNIAWTMHPKPRFKHGFNSDSITVMVDQYDGTKTSTHTIATSFVDGARVLSDLHEYIPLSKGITVFKNGTQLDEVTDYLDWSEQSGTLFTTKISFADPLVADDVVVVKYHSCTLLKDIHYREINSNVVELLFNDILTSTKLHNVRVWGNVVDSGVNDPSKLIDKGSKTVISSVPVWHPAQGFHNQLAMHNVDLESDNDPAIYTSSAIALQKPNHDKLYNSPWNDQEVGTTWLDTTTAQYMPYGDEQVYPNIDTRLRLWGNLVDWSDEMIVDGGTIHVPVVYEWVKSDIHPSEYNAAAIIEEGDNNILEGDRKSGRIFKTLFELKAGEWVKSVPTIKEFDVALDGSILALNGFTIGDEVDIYVNGRIVKHNHKLLSLMMNLNSLNIDHNEADSVRVMKQLPTDADKIAILVEAGTHKHEYLYTAITKIDSFNTPYQEYYFWVREKATRTEGRTMAPKITMIQLANPSNPYMFMQGASIPSIANSGIANSLNQTWKHVVNTDDITRFHAYTGVGANVGVNRQMFMFGVRVDAISSVTVNGQEVAYTLSTGHRSIVINGVTLAENDEVSVKYTVNFYRDTYNMPVHFNKVIIRGLRGLIDEDRRYVLRFTRDFTLRDGDDVTGTNILKSAHENWRLFRREQPYHIDRELWDKITESIVGHKLANKNVRVPSLDRELYDAQYGADTSVGLGDGQTFTDGASALKTILAYLTNPNHTFKPVDINSFFKHHNVDTPENTIEFMNTIYNTFTFENVNHMFFEILLDSFANKREYNGIMKTSWLGLHGVRPFDVGGSAFDD